MKRVTCLNVMKCSKSLLYRMESQAISFLSAIQKTMPKQKLLQRFIAHRQHQQSRSKLQIIYVRIFPRVNYFAINLRILMLSSGTALRQQNGVSCSFKGERMPQRRPLPS